MKRLVSLLSFLLAIFIWIVVQQCSNTDMLESTIEDAKREAELWRDKEGRARATNKVVLADLETLKKVYGDSLTNQSSLIKGLKKSLSNLQSSTAITTTITDTLVVNTIDTVTVDGREVRRFNYSDKWATIEGELYEDDLWLNYRFDNELRLVSFRQRNGLFKPDVVTIEAISYNPNVEITGLTTMQVKERTPKLSLGVQLGVTYSRGVMPYIGIGLSYNILPINITRKDL